jgi:hypothetical protein
MDVLGVVFGISVIVMGLVSLGCFVYFIFSASYDVTANRREPQHGEVRCCGCGGSGGLFAGFGIVPCFCCEGTGVTKLPLTKDYVDTVSKLIKVRDEVSRGE